MENGPFKPAPNPAAPLNRLSGPPQIDRPSPSTVFNAKSLSACSTLQARLCLDYEVAVKHRALPLGLIKLSGYELLTLAVPPLPGDNLSAALKFASGREVKLLPVEASLLDEAIFRAYQGDQRVVQDRLEALRSKPLPESPVFSRPKLEFRPQQGAEAQFLSALIDYAIAHSASDIHLLPTLTGSRTKLRIDGRLLEHPEDLCSAAQHQQLINRLKVLSGLDIAQHHQPQDGSFTVPAAGRDVHLRVSLMPTIHGEKAVIRLLGGDGLLGLGDLELNQKILSFLEAFAHRSEGAVLFAGPTGSGKTTTMYALLQRLQARSLSLVTIEDPVEIVLEGASQTSLHEAAGLDYASALRSVLRQDPDAILLGEIRDEESAKIAFQAALTGHLLLSTVHARSVPEIFLRLQNLGVDHLSIAQAANLLICQRLLPKLCSVCKVVDLNGSNLLGLEVGRPVGCARCDYSGFEGRVLAAEALQVAPEISSRLASGRLDFADAVAEMDYLPLEQSLKELVRSGRISLSQCQQLGAWKNAPAYQ